MTTCAQMDAVAGLEPKAVWEFFAGMNAVPRPSKNEDQIQAYMMGVVEKLGFAAKKDAAGNIVATIPATPGYEHVPITVLQGHLDMVAEKNAGVEHDFDRDGINMVVDTDKENGERILRAEGTTLGADNGVGVCMALSAATDPDCVHGPLEILMTSDEEMGMTGAKALTPDFFAGRRMINLDSEEDYAVYIGCAGGTDVTLNWALPMDAANVGAETCTVTVSGVRGGHSGCDIHRNFANAIRTLASVLIKTGVPFGLASFTGGSKRNAIPREAQAVVTGPKGLADALKKAAAQMQAIVRTLNKEPGGSIEVTAAKAEHGATTAEDGVKVARCLMGIPCGVIAVVPEIAGLVQTSNNISTAECEVTGGKLNIAVGCLTRSSSDDDMHAAVRQTIATAELAGAIVETGNEYSGWQPDIDSPSLVVCKKMYEELFGETPPVLAIHAGLECGIISERVGKMDMVSIGPTILGPHSPDERVFIDSVDKSYRYLKAILKEMAVTA